MREPCSDKVPGAAVSGGGARQLACDSSWSQLGAVDVNQPCTLGSSKGFGWAGQEGWSSLMQLLQ